MSNIETYEEFTLDQDRLSEDEKFVAMWLRGKSNRYTRRNYERAVRPFLAFLAQRKTSLAKCLPSDLIDYQEELDDLAPSTVRLHMSIIRSLFSHAVKLGYLGLNISVAVDLPRVYTSLNERILSPEETQRVIGAGTPKSKRLMEFLYFTAARISEACKLRWRDVRETNRGWIVTLQGKGGKTRHVHLDEDILGERGDEDDFVFATRTGRATHTSEARNMIRRAAVKAGIKKPVSPHWFRHSHITHAIEAGAPIHLVQATAGHASMSTTGMYAHANPKESSGRYLKRKDEK